MIDIKFLRENPDVVRASQKARGEDDSIVEKVLAADEVRKLTLDQFESLRAEQNLLSKSVASAKGDEKAALLESAKVLAAKVKEADAKRAQAESEAKSLIMAISNVLDPQAPIGKEEDSRLGDFIEDAETDRPDTTVTHELLRQDLARMLNELTPRERDVLRLRFGLDDGRQRTLEEVGQLFAVTRERVRQIEVKALRKLRQPGRSSRLREYL